MTDPAAILAQVVVPVPHRDRYNLEPSVCKPLLAPFVAMVISRNDCFHSFSPSHSGFPLFHPRLRHDTCGLVSTVYCLFQNTSLDDPSESLGWWKDQGVVGR